jgi:hypothetical protein
VPDGSVVAENAAILVPEIGVENTQNVVDISGDGEDPA